MTPPLGKTRFQPVVVVERFPTCHSLFSRYYFPVSRKILPQVLRQNHVFKAIFDFDRLAAREAETVTGFQTKERESKETS
jgi:hypothetical protein